MTVRTLYECSHAKVNGTIIYCHKGHPLSGVRGGTLATIRLQRGEPLLLRYCQMCEDFDRNGDPLPKEERGWQYNK